MSTSVHFMLGRRPGMTQKLATKDIAKIPMIKMLGWGPRQLAKLTNILQNALAKMERFTGRRISLKLVLAISHRRDQEATFAILPEKDEIQVYLVHGPKKVLDATTYAVSRELADRFFELYDAEPESISGVRFSIVEDVSVINRGIESMRYFLSTERGLKVNEEGLQELFTTLAEHYGREILKIKLSYYLLQPRIQLAKDISTAVNAVVADFCRKVSPTVVDTEEVPLWSMIAYMAMHATLSKKFAYAEGYLKCQGVLSGKTAQHMFGIEFLQMPKEDLDYFRHYPIETARQFKLAPAGYNVLFNAFQAVFENYYERMRIEGR